MCAKEPDFDDPEFEVLMEVIGSGTASILDVHTVGQGPNYDVEPFAAADTLSLFGTATPTRADFERADSARRCRKSGMGDTTYRSSTPPARSRPSGSGARPVD